MAELGQQTVEFSTLVRRTAEESFLSLKDLVDKSKSTQVSDSEKKINLLKFIVKSQQRFLRLNVLAKWCQQVPLIQYTQQLVSTLSSHDICFTETADQLFYTHGSLQQARAPIYDVPSAIEILLTGSYDRVPKCVEDIGIQSVLNEGQQGPALKKLDAHVRSKLLETSLPKEISQIRVSDGTALLRVEGEFKVLITLGYRGHLHLWRILHLEILVGERTGPVRLEELQRFALGDDLERRMANADEQRQNPFTVLYSVLHEFCIALVMDTVIRQVHALRLGRWKDAIRFELISDVGGGASSAQVTQDGEYEGSGYRTPGVKIIYWLDLGSNDVGLCPFIRIEPGPNLHINCYHSTFAIDPCTGKEVDLYLDQGCIDVEKLVLKAIRCNRYTRLLEISKQLVKNSEAFRANSGDVLLRCNMGVSDNQEYDKKDVGLLGKQSDGQEVLCVRAYASSFFILGINVRNGRYQLQSSRNVVTPLALSESEEALNQGNLSATEVFINLRSKSILHLFASIGKFLGLEVFENGLSSVKVPKTVCGDSSYLLMGFPNCGSSYYLLLHPNRDFKIIFKLLEMHPNTLDVLRFKRINITEMHMLDDAINLSILDLDKVSHFLPEVGPTTQSSDPNPNREGSICPPPSSFSSVVDVVFGKKTISSSLSMSQIGSVILPVPAQYNDLKGLRPSIGGNSTLERLSVSKSEQDLASLRSTQLVEVGSLRPLDEDHPRVRNERSRDVVFGGRSNGSSVLSCITTPVSSLDADIDTSSENDKTRRKRKFTNMVNFLPSLGGLLLDGGVPKRSKLTNQPLPHIPISWNKILNSKQYSFGDVIAEANKGNVVPGVYISALLHVVRHCSLCIKHAMLTSQMEALGIPYVEEVGLKNAYSNIWFRIPTSRGGPWRHICLRLGRPGNMCWDVKIADGYFTELWELKKGSSNTAWGKNVRIANTSDLDSHIRYDSEGVVLSYGTVEEDSVEKVVSDICRLASARRFAIGMRKVLGVEECGGNVDGKGLIGVEKLSEQMKKAFRIEAVGVMSVWFSFGTGVLARFVVEWESGKDGCTMHVSPDQLWPHTKFLEDFINGGEVSSLLDCIRLTAGPLHALAAATRPARAGQGVIPNVGPASSTLPKQANYTPNINSTLSNHAGVMLAGGARGGIVPSSLLPIDVSVVLRGPYWIRIIFRKHFAVDMRCFAGDQVWLQPATPPKGGPSVGGSLPCPQFRPFIMEHVAQELNGLDPSQLVSGSGGRVNVSSSLGGLARPGIQVGATNRAAMGGAGLGLRRSPGGGVPSQFRGELNTAIIGLGDDGGYGGGWVPVVALKKVLRGILKYLGVLWLFAQLPDLLKEILGSTLKENEGALLNLDQEQPALRFFVGGYVFAVSVHRVQLLLQVLSVKRFHNQQQQQQQQNSAPTQEELTQSEISEICDYFSRRVASEPYDASRVASFITLLTLPISVLREFLKLITWKKVMMSQAQGGDMAPSQKPRIELCLENHGGGSNGSNPDGTKSNIHYDRAHNWVEFGLTVVLDPAHIPHMNAAGGAAWLPYCVSVRLRYSFGDNPSVSFVGMEGSHGGRGCWFRVDDWEKCKQRVARSIEVHGTSPADVSQGRLRLVADNVQRTLHLCLQGLRDGGSSVAM